MGSGFFVGVLTCGVVILASKSVIKLNASSFIRDILFYIFGLIWISAFSFFGKINIYMGVSVLLLYAM